jgi:hypothetical protein
MRWKFIAVAAITVAGFRPVLAADLPTPNLPPSLPIAVYKGTGI